MKTLILDTKILPTANTKNYGFLTKKIILLPVNKFKVPTDFRDQSLNYEPNMNTTYNFQNFHNFEQLEEGAFKVVTNN